MAQLSEDAPADRDRASPRRSDLHNDVRAAQRGDQAVAQAFEISLITQRRATINGASAISYRRNAARYECFMDSAPGHLTRFVSRRNLSIIHGDAHAWNDLMPQNGGDDVRLFDWDNWRIGLVANDLAYMMATPFIGLKMLDRWTLAGSTHETEPTSPDQHP